MDGVIRITSGKICDVLLEGPDECICCLGILRERIGLQQPRYEAVHEFTHGITSAKLLHSLRGHHTSFFQLGTDSGEGLAFGVKFFKVVPFLILKFTTAPRDFFAPCSVLLPELSTRVIYLV